MTLYRDYGPDGAACQHLRVRCAVAILHLRHDDLTERRRRHVRSIRSLERYGYAGVVRRRIIRHTRAVALCDAYLYGIAHLPEELGA